MSVRTVRFLRLLFELDYPGGRPVVELAERLGVTRRTIERDLNQMLREKIAVQWHKGRVELSRGSFRKVLD